MKNIRAGMLELCKAAAMEQTETITAVFDLSEMTTGFELSYDLQKTPGENSFSMLEEIKIQLHDKLDQILDC